jgi:hypothetical protein
MPRSATEKDKHPRKDKHQTWRERNPDKYRACQRETMRKRRAASRASETPVSAVERVAGTAALQECAGRAVGPETVLPEVTLHPGDGVVNFVSPAAAPETIVAVVTPAVVAEPVAKPETQSEERL